mmetsp:Transcript_49806/g.159159  ORF Transcript_49806/g.159159 Transcript_49806/m.159159 type:complete len:294 (+) Transcript_49806:982-1863(+)
MTPHPPCRRRGGVLPQERPRGALLRGAVVGVRRAVDGDDLPLRVRVAPRHLPQASLVPPPAPRHRQAQRGWRARPGDGGVHPRQRYIHRGGGGFACRRGRRGSNFCDLARGRRSYQAGGRGSAQERSGGWRVHNSAPGHAARWEGGAHLLPALLPVLRGRLLLVALLRDPPPPARDLPRHHLQHLQRRPGRALRGVRGGPHPGRALLLPAVRGRRRRPPPLQRAPRALLHHVRHVPGARGGRAQWAHRRRPRCMPDRPPRVRPQDNRLQVLQHCARPRSQLQVALPAVPAAAS